MMLDVAILTPTYTQPCLRVIRRVTNENYWSSTEVLGDANTAAWLQDFNDGLQGSGGKSITIRLRCVRAFTP
ncbi:hypothetical protein Ljam_0359 [Legionella jamestowniensis]|uniref:Uncharacterized protein n=1 Tax=Legionella jamestowniensis TaxID=455 RepID=A0A0W0UW95_9GAMM|nr:hypothetical protein Ljam_0359 [Legionella jamestowniensis]